MNRVLQLVCWSYPKNKNSRYHNSFRDKEWLKNYPAAILAENSTSALAFPSA